MKRTLKHPGAILGAMVLCLMLSSMCILAVPAAHNRHALTMICSGVFWFGMLAGYGLLIYVNIIRRKQTAGNEKRRTGIFTFFRNAYAGFVDALWIVSVLLLTASFFAERLQGSVQFVFAFMTVFMFHMHCILNGENFRYLYMLIRRDDK